MARCLCLSLLLVAITVGASADPTPPRSAENEVKWSDTFKDPKLKEWGQVDGEVLFNKKRGGILLSPSCIVARDTVVGFDVEAEVDVIFPADLGAERGPGRGLHLSIRARYNLNSATTYLGLEKGKPILGVMAYPNTPVSLAGPGIDPEGPWTLKVRLRYGVIQAKAWPKGKPEPKDWQITRYTGESSWEPRIFVLYTDKEDSAFVMRAEVRGKKPATDLFLKHEMNQDKERLVGLVHRMTTLRRDGEIDKALDTAKTCVKASEKVFGAEHAVTAICVHNLAAAYYDSGAYTQALETFESALTLRRKILPTDHPGIALSIEGVGVSLAAKGKWDEAEKKYREVLAFRRRVLGDEHPETAIAWNNLGQSLTLQAEHKKSLECFRESLKIRQGVLGNRHPDTAKAHNNLGYQFFVMGEYLDAKPQFETALKTYRNAYGPDRANHPDIAMVENNLGFLLLMMGELKESEEHFVKALDIYTKMGGPKHPLRATILNNLGLLATDRGDLVAARKLLEDALAIRKDVLGKDHAETAVVQMNLSLVLLRLNDPAAIEMFPEALETLSKKLPPDHPSVAQALSNFGVIAGEARLAGIMAEDYLERALAIKRKKLGDVHPETTLTINNLAHQYMSIGKTQKAETLLTEALAACREKLGDDNPLTCLVRHNLGGSYYAQEKYAPAFKELKLAVDGFTKVYGRQHPLTAQSLNMLGITLVAQGKRAEALVAACDAAAGYAAIARKNLAGTPESQHAALIEQWRPQVRFFLAIAAIEPNKLEGQGPALLRTVMDWKATSGRALLDRLEALSVGQVPEAGEKYRELQTRRRSLVQSVMRGVGTEGVEKYNEDLDKVRERVEKLERDLAQQVKGYAAVAQAREADPADVAKQLPPGSVLIEFVLLEEIEPEIGKLPKGISREASYAALVVIPKAGGGDPDVKLVPLGAAKDVDGAIKEWRADVQRKTRNPVSEENLRERLWERLAEVIPAGTKRIFIAPAGQISLIPFEALWSDGAFLIEKYLISYCSTGRDLIPRPAPPGEPGAPVVVADPDFDHLPANVPEPKKPLPGGGVSSLAYKSEPPKEDSLPGFATEAEAVSKLLGAKFPGKLKSYLRVDASEENSQAIARPRVLYFITHGNFLTDQKTLIALEGRPVSSTQVPAQGQTALLGTTFGEDPRLRSYLCLTGFNRWKERAALKRPDGTAKLSDGILTAREVETLDLWGTDLVVTAACKTGEGEIHVGEGVMGLRRAFQQAGARTVVTSLWSVADDKTATLLPKFLGYYLDGTSKAEALRKAQLEMIRDLRAAKKAKPEYQAPPFFWAAFICHGLPDTPK